MEPLKFICAKTQTDKADFRIEYYNPKNWNDLGYFVRYRLFAEPSITGKEEVKIGIVRIVASDQNPGVSFDDHGHVIPRSELDAVSRIMGDKPFEELSEKCYSELSEESSAALFVLLSPEQRKAFVESMHICVDYDTFKQISEIDAVRKGLYRNLRNKELVEKKLASIRKYLFSEIDYKQLPVL